LRTASIELDVGELDVGEFDIGFLPGVCFQFVGDACWHRVHDFPHSLHRCFPVIESAGPRSQRHPFGATDWLGYGIWYARNEVVKAWGRV
jgi:hypothetical protein